MTTVSRPRNGSAAGSRSLPRNDPHPTHQNPTAATVTRRTDAPVDQTVAVTRGRVDGGHDAGHEVGRGGAANASGRERATWKTVALPAEHGGWGLSAEPGLLGLLVAPSWAGAAIAVAAVVAFLVRTPLKLAVIDRRRGRVLERTRLATKVAAGELALLAVLAATALALAGPRWLVPIAVATPFIVLELWFDIRSRGRRLIPELAGSVGICSVVAAVAIAGGADARLAVALWLILAARAVATVAFARVQVVRFRKELQQKQGAKRPGAHEGSVDDAPTRSSDWAQVAGLAVAVAAVAVSRQVVLGAAFMAVVAVGELVVVRRPPIKPKVLGFTQLGIGLGLVAVTALSAALI